MRELWPRDIRNCTYPKPDVTEKACLHTEVITDQRGYQNRYSRRDEGDVGAGAGARGGRVYQGRLDERAALAVVAACACNEHINQEE